MTKQSAERGTTRNTPLFRLGFRPFFLCAAAFSCISMLIWLWLYVSGTQPAGWALTSQIWHAHEMIFGYALAVICGFLLTAVKNWTSIPTLRGKPLAALALLWLSARIALLSGLEHALILAMLLDTLFGIGMVGCLIQPIVRSKQWKQLGVIAVSLLIVLANMLFYSGIISGSASYLYGGIYFGLYLIVALIMLIAGRVIPFFAERSLNPGVKLNRRDWIDRANMIIFCLFVVIDLVFLHRLVVACLSAALFVINTARLWGWYNPGIWHRPLLWVLYLAYAFITLAFALKSLSAWLPLAQPLSMHAFAYGGIGLMTLGMMARVALGHTGRNVHDPPSPLLWMFLLLAVGAACRVILPLIDVQHFFWWIVLSQIAWIGAFATFVVVYFPILVKPRIDGRDG